MRKYLLSTGLATDKIEEYIVDLFRLYLQVLPGDIPGLPQLGFNFILTNTKKADIQSTVSSRASVLVDKIQSRFGESVKIIIDSIEVISENLVRITITVNNTLTEKIVIEV